MKTRQCIPGHRAHDHTLAIIRHCILLIVKFWPPNSLDLNPEIQGLGSHTGENVSYASTRHGQFEAAPDRYVV